jgi:hypothetical protein
MITIKLPRDGYLLEFEGEDYECPDPSVGFCGGYSSWSIVGGTDDCGRELDEVTLKTISDDIALNDEPFGDRILVDLSNAYEDWCQTDPEDL